MTEKEETFWGYGIEFWNGCMMIFIVLSVSGISMYLLGGGYDSGKSAPATTQRRTYSSPQPTLSTRPSDAIKFVETDLDYNPIPKWTGRIDPDAIGTQLMKSEFDNLFDGMQMDWDKWKPSIGKMQQICGRNDACYRDFGYKR